MAISRLQASLAAATNEVTVAAANINFDFSLVRCEAPKEYVALGNNLSRIRKDDAEMGTIHTTARRLGALFDGIPPPTPKIVKAYGTRVSEISEAILKQSELQKGYYSIFAAYSGVDGASIWAAATSSTAAIHVQLLACMLARMWKGPEATSVWVELVKERKKSIASQWEGGDALPFSALNAAAQIDIARSQLADWDASARAWLSSADKIKDKQQEQLTNILDNVDISVNQDNKVFTSVISAWTCALTSMENLLNGMPQAMSSGSTLLTLGAWNLYPDILLVGHETTETRFNDPLVAPGGILTVGLAGSKTEDRQGISWSLSLAHLRYYGHPVQTRGELSRDSARITFPQFCQAAFGALLGYWEVNESRSELFARIFVAIEDVFEQELERLAKTVEDDKWIISQVETCSNKLITAYMRDSSHWFHLLAAAAQTCLDDNSEEHVIARKLVRKGIRQSPGFIGEFSPGYRMEHGLIFGLMRSQTFLGMLRGPEASIAYLRSTAEKWPFNSSDIIIQYHDHLGHVQYATALVRLQNSGHKRKHSNRHGEGSYIHRRWLLNNKSQYNPSDPGFPTEEVIWRSPHDILNSSSDAIDVQDAPSVRRPFKYYYGIKGQACIFVSDRAVSSAASKNLTNPHPVPIGREQGPGPNDRLIPRLEEVSIEVFLWGLKSGWVDPARLLERIKRYLDSVEQIWRTMNALSTISVIYKLLPGATIAIETLNQPICNTLWCNAMHRKLSKDGLRRSETSSFYDQNLLNRHIAFSCVAYLESGHCNIEPTQLEDVFALSCGDSIYVAMALLCDPYEVPAPYELKRIIGNVGKAGIAMLVPPQGPILRKPKTDSWRLISTSSFDGCAEDSFQHTTLHLSFTDYTVPVYYGVRGAQDSQVFLLESVVSVHDRGIWVGDIDVLAAVQSSLTHRLSTSPSCHHHKDQKPGKDLVSIESWDEVLDLPHEVSVARANNNWVARLAIVSVFMQLFKESTKYERNLVEHGIMVCPSSMCWKCLYPDSPEQYRSFSLQLPSSEGRLYLY